VSGLQRFAVEKAQSLEAHGVLSCRHRGNFGRLFSDFRAVFSCFEFPQSPVAPSRSGSLRY
jgi:hypothetical protein